MLVEYLISHESIEEAREMARRRNIKDFKFIPYYPLDERRRRIKKYRVLNRRCLLGHFSPSEIKTVCKEGRNGR